MMSLFTRKAGTWACLAIWLSACGAEEASEPSRETCGAFGLPSVSLKELEGQFKGAPIEITDSLQWEGYVISTDASSNIYGEIYMQDSISGPGGGMVFHTDLREIHSLLPYGARVSVKLTGLYLGQSGGAFEVGGALPIFGNVSVGRLPAAVFRDHVRLSCDEGSEPEPTEIRLGELSDSLLNTLVQIKGVGFLPGEVGLPFAEPGQVTRRTLQDCQGNTIVLRNSGFSDFSSEPLPKGKGNATGILSSHRSKFELLIRSPADLQFEDTACPGQAEERSSDFILISEMADPDNLPEARFIELFNASDISFSLDGWELRRFTNDNPQPGPPVPLDGLRIGAGEALVLSAYPEVFEETYGFPPDAQSPRNGPADSNGDDSIELVDPYGNVADAFGSPGIDGSGTSHEFEDGRALRIKGVGRSNPKFDPSEWIIFNDTGAEGTVKEPQLAPGDYSPGSHHAPSD